MSECRTCRFAAYDGTCLAKGKLTVLDAPACGLYRPTAAAQIAELKRENAELRELVKDIDEVADPFLWEFIGRRMRELGIEVEG